MTEAPDTQEEDQYYDPQNERLFSLATWAGGISWLFLFFGALQTFLPIVIFISERSIQYRPLQIYIRELAYIFWGQLGDFLITLLIFAILRVLRHLLLLVLDIRENIQAGEEEESNFYEKKDLYGFPSFLKSLTLYYLILFGSVMAFNLITGKPMPDPLATYGLPLPGWARPLYYSSNYLYPVFEILAYFLIFRIAANIIEYLLDHYGRLGMKETTEYEEEDEALFRDPKNYHLLRLATWAGALGWLVILIGIGQIVVHYAFVRSNDFNFQTAYDFLIYIAPGLKYLTPIAFMYFILQGIKATLFLLIDIREQNQTVKTTNAAGYNRLRNLTDAANVLSWLILAASVLAFLISTILSSVELAQAGHSFSYSFPDFLGTELFPRLDYLAKGGFIFFVIQVITEITHFLLEVREQQGE